MGINTKMVIGGIVIVVAGAAVALSWDRGRGLSFLGGQDGATSGNGAVLPAPAAPSAVDPSTFTSVPFISSTPYLAMRGEYPQFTNAVPAFNDRILGTVLDAAASHVKDATENWQARVATAQPGENIGQYPADPNDLAFLVSWSPAQANGRFVSFIMRYGGYTGGAHGYEDMTTFNYDVAAKRDIALQDIFPNDPDYLTKLSAASRIQLATHFKTAFGPGADVGLLTEMMETGTAPTEENFKHFTFTDTAVTVYFEQYQVAPYAAGEQTVTISR